MRTALFVSAIFLSIPAWADDALWASLKTEPYIIVLIRHTHTSGGNPLAWDESGNCLNESVLSNKGKAQAHNIGEAFVMRDIKPNIISSPMCRCLETAKLAFNVPITTDPDLREVASANGDRMMNFENTAKTLIAKMRGNSPVVFISHRPNISQLTMELIEQGELLVGRSNEKGEIDVLGKIVLHP